MSARWKDFAGELAWPTALMGVGSAVGLATSAALALTGVIPMALAAAISTVCAYVAFTPAHEAAHGNIAGRHTEHRWLDEVVGWISGLVLFAPFSAFKVIHLTHHSHTNDAERDPDFWVAGNNPLSIALRCLTIVPHYYSDFLVGPTSKTAAAKKARVSTVGVLGTLVAGMIAAAAAGYGVELLVLWVGPAVVASGMLAFAFDWLPHQPHNVQGRFRDTRIVLFPGLETLLLGQNYHLMHHLFPRVPFYSYRACFEAMRPELEAKGAPIVDLRPGAGRLDPNRAR